MAVQLSPWSGDRPIMYVDFSGCSLYMMSDKNCAFEILHGLAPTKKPSKKTSIGTKPTTAQTSQIMCVTNGEDEMRINHNPPSKACSVQWSNVKTGSALEFAIPRAQAKRLQARMLAEFNSHDLETRSRQSRDIKLFGMYGTVSGTITKYRAKRASS